MKKMICDDDNHSTNSDDDKDIACDCNQLIFSFITAANGDDTEKQTTTTTTTQTKTFLNKNVRGVDHHDILKSGVSYYDIRDQMKTLDMIAFRGTDFVSDFISALEDNHVEPGAGEFTHVGVIIRGDSFPVGSPYHCENCVYVFESTQGGNLGDGVPDIDGNGRLGVQLRNMDRVAEMYDFHPQSKMAWLQMKEEIRNNTIPTIDPMDVLYVFRKYNGLKYDLSVIDLFSAVFPWMRSIRQVLTSSCSTSGVDDRQFCSELAANVYKEFGILQQQVDAENVLPADFIPSKSSNFTKTFDKDNDIHVLFHPPVLFTSRPTNITENIFSI